MKALLLMIVGVNLAFYLATNVNKVDDDLTETDKNFPGISILNPNGSVDDILSPPKKANTRTNTTRKESKPQTESRVVKAPPSKPNFVPKKKLQVAIAAPANTGAANGSCVALGPFVDKDDAHELNEKLIALNVESELKSFREKEKFLVYLQARTVAESPDETLKVLKRKGIRYKLSNSQSQKFKVDFGWYKSSRSATTRMKQLRHMGFAPKIDVKGSKGEQIWVNYSMPRGKKLPKRARSIIKETREEVFLQRKNCTKQTG